ncbi:glycosyltransferase [Cryobacterium levicorallinum]|uniref:Glycosyltransferase n=1 Tax=Cryobacterium levicorallinum TaxID=995038 RepID=A0A1I3DQ12_9MICO|nr:glycosyltransferase [Cryobacterium levicorallinum]TFB86261.1 glycosyltransferase [Cryobacterium levicorallinum]SFH88807.1 Glycosyltransferase involved in cell wall bisynthesis [Cryobacterium levicorallinum]
MKIIHVINSLATGGAETLVVDLATSMRSLGHDVKIVAIGRTRGVPLDVARARELRVNLLGRSTRDLGALLALRKSLRGADIVHVHLFPSLYLVPLVARGAVLHYTEHSTWNRRRDKRIFRVPDRFAYRKYSRIIAISEGVRKPLQKYLAKLGVHSSVAVVANGIGDAFFSSKLRRHRDVKPPLKLIAVGTLDNRKNFGDAIRAVAQCPLVQLTIVGVGPERDLLQNLIATLHVSDRIRLHGPSDDVAALMDQHHALLSTSRFEGFSLVAAEAMALGLPVIGPDVDGFNESVIDQTTGLLFDQSRGVPDIVETILELQANVGAFAEMSENALEHALKFQIQRAAESYLAIYADSLQD